MSMTDRRYHTCSAKNGPRKLINGMVIIRCGDCPMPPCPYQDASPWPFSEIASGCPLPDAPEDDLDPIETEEGRKPNEPE